jgi:hypothetical protein
MTVRLPRVLLIAVLFASVFAPFIAQHRAQASVSLRVSPALIELEADPGAKGEQPITVENNGDETMTVGTAVETYKQAADEWSAVEWLRAEPESFTLEPGEVRQIDVQIDVPDGLNSGGRYAMVTFTTGGGQTEGNGASIAGKIGVAFLMTVDGKGKVERGVDLDHFAPVLEPDGRIGFSALLKNEGNVHANPVGVVSILDAHDEPFGSLEVVQSTALLPGDQTVLAAEGSLPMASDSEYQAEIAIDYGAKKAVKSDVAFRPVAKLAVTGISVCENLDRGPTVTVSLQNQGELGLIPPLQLELRNSSGIAAPQPASPETGIVWPGEAREVVADVSDRLSSGDYTIHLRADYASPDAVGRTVLPPIEQDFSFSIGGLNGNAAPLCGA